MKLFPPTTLRYVLHLSPKKTKKTLLCQWGIAPLALKKQIIAYNLYMAGEARGSCIANSCPVKTERRSGLGFVGRSQATHQWCQISRKAFLMAPAPWRPYFTDMPSN